MPIRGVPHTVGPAGVAKPPANQQTPDIVPAIVLRTNVENEASLAEIFTLQVGGTAAFGSDQFVSGARSVKVTQTGSASGSVAALPGGASTNIQVGRVWVRLSTATLSATQALLAHSLSNGQSATIRVNATGLWQAILEGGTAVTGPSLTANAWHVVDYRINLSVSPHTMDWRVDGVAQTQAKGTTVGSPAARITAYRIVTSGANTVTIWFDDFQASTDYWAYPLSDIPVTGLLFTAGVVDTALQFSDRVVKKSPWVFAVVDAALEAGFLFPSASTYPGAAVYTSTVGETDTVGPATIRAVTSTGVSQTDTVATPRLRVPVDTGVNQSDAIATTRVRVIVDTGVSETDSVQKAATHGIADTGVSQTDSVASAVIRVRPLTDTGITQSDTVAATRGLGVADTGVSQTDSVATTRVRAITDTGKTGTDTVATTRVRVVADTGAAVTDSVSRSFPRPVTDTGVAQSDTVTRTLAAPRGFTDTGVAQSDTVTRTPAFPRVLADTGATVTDTVSTTRRRVLIDTGSSVSDQVATPRLRVPVDTGVSQSDTVTSTIIRVRVIIDTGASITDAVVRTASSTHTYNSLTGFPVSTVWSGTTTQTGWSGVPAQTGIVGAVAL